MIKMIGIITLEDIIEELVENQEEEEDTPSSDYKAPQTKDSGTISRMSARPTNIPVNLS